MDKQELLEKLWLLTVRNLVTKLEMGDFTSQDLNVARQLLKDHGITVGEVEASPLGDMADLLPFRKVSGD
jgi:hypothetical protein